MLFDIEKVKFVVTIPEEYVGKVRNAVCLEGAGVIGNYTFCTTLTESIGTFIPNENSNAFIGTKNKLEFVKEGKLEFVCDIKIVKKVVSTIRKVHPYEEPAIDIIPLIDEKNFC